MRTKVKFPQGGEEEEEGEAENVVVVVVRRALAVACRDSSIGNSFNLHCSTHPGMVLAYPVRLQATHLHQLVPTVAQPAY